MKNEMEGWWRFLAYSDVDMNYPLLMKILQPLKNMSSKASSLRLSEGGGGGHQEGV